MAALERTYIITVWRSFRFWYRGRSVNVATHGPIAAESETAAAVVSTLPLFAPRRFTELRAASALAARR